MKENKKLDKIRNKLRKQKDNDEDKINKIFGKSEIDDMLKRIKDQEDVFLKEKQQILDKLNDDEKQEFEKELKSMYKLSSL